MEEHRPEKLLDQVRACPAEGAEGMPSASRAVAGQCKHYSYRAEQAYVVSIFARHGASGVRDHG